MNVMPVFNNNLGNYSVQRKVDKTPFGASGAKIAEELLPFLEKLKIKPDEVKSIASEVIPGTKNYPPYRQLTVFKLDGGGVSAQFDAATSKLEDVSTWSGKISNAMHSQPHTIDFVLPSAIRTYLGNTTGIDKKNVKGLLKHKSDPNKFILIMKDDSKVELDLAKRSLDIELDETKIPKVTKSGNVIVCTPKGFVEVPESEVSKLEAPMAFIYSDKEIPWAERNIKSFTIGGKQ